MKTEQRIFHVKCDTCNANEPIDYRVIPVSSGDKFVMCSACLTIFANMSALEVFDMGVNAGMMRESRRALDMGCDDCDYEGYRYTNQEFMESVTKLMNRMKAVNDARPE